MSANNSTHILWISELGKYKCVRYLLFVRYLLLNTDLKNEHKHNWGTEHSLLYNLGFQTSGCNWRIVVSTKETDVRQDKLVICLVRNLGSWHQYMYVGIEQL